MTPSLLDLGLKFWQIGSFSIGGGYAIIALIEDLLVNQEHWLTMKEYTDIIAISQMTPGPLAINTSSFVGLKQGGILGAQVTETKEGIAAVYGMRKKAVGLLGSAAGSAILQ